MPTKKTQKPIEVVNFTMSTKLTGGQTATAIELLTMLVQSFPEERLLFIQAFDDNDFTRARELFHKLRGGLSYVCTPDVEQRAKTLHERVKALEIQQGNLADLRNELHALFKAVDAVGDWLAVHAQQ